MKKSIDPDHLASDSQLIRTHTVSTMCVDTYYRLDSCKLMAMGKNGASVVHEISSIFCDTYIIRLLCRCAAVPAHEAYIAHTAHPVLCTHFGFKKGIRAVSCPYPTPICVK